MRIRKGNAVKGPPPLPANMWKSLLPPQPSHCPELAHTSLPNMPRPLKTPLGWGLPRPRGLVRRPELWGCLSLSGTCPPVSPGCPGPQVSLQLGVGVAPGAAYDVSARLA